MSSKSNIMANPIPEDKGLERGSSTSSYTTKHDIDNRTISKLDSEQLARNFDIEKNILPVNQPVHHDPTDTNVVDWDGPDDPENPLNWTLKKKWRNAGLLAAMTFIT